ncbi:MAG: hypothetical protein JOZ54_00050 [Acidobacteria bacterium]|nr:hypothetical protein [Acidobacteriota bacterium]
MTKRMLLLVVLVLAIATVAAPAAMADHCRKCRLDKCTIAASGGFPTCDDATGVCITTGATCTGPHPLIDEDLASRYAVVSVERLDEPQTAAKQETRVAQLEAPRTTINR